ncbi:DUF2796 domain-containing protein [bacterium AH-315-E07]|nr:DUF2796 domain-containing protein [bacterium AH-315-E07]
MKHLISISALLVVCFSAPLMAHHVSNHQDDQVEAETSQPGHGRMTVAAVAGSVEIEMYTQTANVLGFEGAPKNAEQKTVLTDAIAWLSKAENVFEFPADANCNAIVAEINSVIVDGKTKAGDKKSPEFDGYYVFDCGDASKLDEIKVKIFNQYKSFEEIQVKRVGGGDSATYVTLTPKKNTIKLK